ncbi:MAG: TRAP transporter substrate-binding protein [Synergistaceae bacterium]|jgi:TRAP-type C4-dicarboxylate transport system substrate-binding protein|nr:TRAP transporter substrate-binding protein [Synergistaceae bacterium]
MKKFVCIAVVSVFFAALGLVLCASPSMAASSVKLVYAEVNPADSLMGRTAQAFKEKVEELSKGSLVIDIQFSGVLGAENDVLDTMIGGGGTVDMSRIATYSLNSYGSKLMSLLSVPYTLSGREHFWKIARSELGAKLLNEATELKLGVKGLFYVEEGFRHFFFNSNIEGLANLAGKKIRVSNDPIMTGMVNGLKASPTVVSFNELYSSLSTKVVDGAEQPIVNYQSNSFFEVAPFMILDGHTLGCGEVLITDSAWDKLSDEHKAFIVEAGKYASEFNANLSAQIEKECIDSLKTAGVTFIEVKDLGEWQEACKDVIAQFSKGMEEDYKAILDMAK